MRIDIGLIVVIVAVLIFYLRLIVLQRERAKQLSRQAGSRAMVKARGKNQQKETPARYSILSQNPRDLAIGAAGLLAVVVGILLNTQILPIPAAQPYWWIPTAAGIVAFSWAFKL